MSIYAKLAQARVKLQEKNLNKSGRNTYSSYSYFELKDFLPEINRIFNELKICSVVSFNHELATLTIYDSESEGKIEFTSPMAKASLKGCHEIQNLGAVETYQRRYLYMTALEIVESDVLDENTGNPNRPVEKKPAEQAQKQRPSDKWRAELVATTTQDERNELYKKHTAWIKANKPDWLDKYDQLYDEVCFEMNN